MTEIMSTADLKSLLEKRCRDKIEQDDEMEREELLREIRELENHISESNSSASVRRCKLCVSLRNPLNRSQDSSPIEIHEFYIFKKQSCSSMLLSKNCLQQMTEL